MKKLFAALALVVLVSACSDSPEPDTAESEGSQTQASASAPSDSVESVIADVESWLVENDVLIRIDDAVVQSRVDAVSHIQIFDPLNQLDGRIDALFLPECERGVTLTVGRRARRNPPPRLRRCRNRPPPPRRFCPPG